MHNSTSQYPVSLIEVDLNCARGMTALYVVASARTFGVLVPVSTLPKITCSDGEEDAHNELFGEIVDIFINIVKEYIDMADGRGVTLPLKDPESLGVAYSGEFLRLTGSIAAYDNSDAKESQLRLEGEYFFIAETGTDIYEFLSSQHKNSEGHTLH